MELFGFNTEKSFEYENGFYLTSNPARLGKNLAHYELYKMIIEKPGHVVECGVFKGISLIRWLTFRNLLENPMSRKVIGFDTFSHFPEALLQEEINYRNTFVQNAGDQSISTDEFHKVMQHKNISNYELVAGDINETIPNYVKANPHLKISLLHIDVDLYQPSITALEYLYEKVVRGGVIVFDDYGTFPGETKAVDDFFADKEITFKKFPFSHQIPVYMTKDD
jgi:hypothetical protein